MEGEARVITDNNYLQFFSEPKELYYSTTAVTCQKSYDCSFLLQ